MELWMLYAIIWSIASGVFWFLQNIEWKSSINSNSFIIYSHLWMVIMWLFLLIINNSQIYLNFEMFIYALILNFLYVIVLKFRLKSLKFLDTSSFFINYRIFSSILLIILGQIFFGEYIDSNEYIWIILWFIIFYLLIEKKQISDDKKDVWKWYIYLWLAVIILSLIWILQKYITTDYFDLDLYLVYSGFVWIFATYVLKWKSDNFWDVVRIKNKRDFLLLFAWAIVMPISFYSYCSALAEWWDLAIVYKIISYWLFIPIILSVIFYKEKITLKKLLAFILTIASIGLFV